MILANIEDLMRAIENHTALKLAGIRFPERLRALENRREQINGMVELVRRIPLNRELLRALEAHREVLRREIDDE